jgi:hypothetical protein
MPSGRTRKYDSWSRTCFLGLLHLEPGGLPAQTFGCGIDDVTSSTPVGARSRAKTSRTASFSVAASPSTQIAESSPPFASFDRSSPQATRGFDAPAAAPPAPSLMERKPRLHQRATAHCRLPNPLCLASRLPSRLASSPPRTVPIACRRELGSQPAGYACQQHSSYLM